MNLCLLAVPCLVTEPKTNAIWSSSWPPLWGSEKTISYPPLLLIYHPFVHQDIYSSTHAVVQIFPRPSGPLSQLCGVAITNMFFFRGIAFEWIPVELWHHKRLWKPLGVHLSTVFWSYSISVYVCACVSVWIMEVHLWMCVGGVLGGTMGSNLLKTSKPQTWWELEHVHVHAVIKCRHGHGYVFLCIYFPVSTLS